MCALILIVEDEQIIAADLEAKVIRLGHRVVGSAASGEEAIHLAKNLTPDLVLMDIRIQGAMDGVETARQIQAHRNVPVIFITAYGEMLLPDPKLMRPPVICLSKPFSLYQLQTILDSVLKDNAPAA